jgi:hypothetical protein
VKTVESEAEIATGEKVICKSYRYKNDEGGKELGGVYVYVLFIYM